MVKCAVPACRNNNSKKQIGISFHRFPKDLKLRKKWLQSIGRPVDTKITTNSIVCSVHFKDEHINKTPCGVRLKENACPTISKSVNKSKPPLVEIGKHNYIHEAIEIFSRQPVNCKFETIKPVGWELLDNDSDDLQLVVVEDGATVQRDDSDLIHYRNRERLQFDDEIKICRICLATNCKMYPVWEGPLKETFKALVNNDSVISELSGVLCWECCSRLRGAARLKEKARHAHSILIKYLHDTYRTTEEIVRSINRVDLGLCSDITISSIEIIDLEPSEAEVDIKLVKTEFDDNFYCEDSNDEMSDDKPLFEFAKESNDKAKDDKFFTRSARTSETNIFNIKTEGNKIVIGTDRPKKTPKRKINTPNGDKLQSKLQKERKDLTKILSAGFDIRKLSPKEQVEAFEKKKDTPAYLMQPYKCILCYTGFLEEAKLSSHMVKHDKERGKYECYVCKIRTQKSHKLNSHIKRQHAEEYTCKQCQMVTTRSFLAYSHIKTHATFKCPHCPAEFTHSTTYLSHRRLKHVSEHVCELCGYTFLGKKGIFVHKYRMHQNDTPPLEGPHCAECDVKFVSQEAYNRHLGLSAKHSTDETMKQLRTDAKSKMAMAKQPITCELCGMIVLGMKSYGWHFRLKHPNEKRTQFPKKRSNPVICDQCGKEFSNTTFLNDHMSIHTGKKSFQCEVCNKLFAMRSRLQLHLKTTHRADYKQFSCDECGGTFSNYGNLYRHKKIHEGKMQYKCTHCEKRFNTSDGVRLHTKHVHLNVPWPKRDRTSRRQNVADRWNKMI